MEQERYQQQYKAFVQQAEQRLNELCDVYLPVKAQISQAARYSLLGGGKQVGRGHLKCPWPCAPPARPARKWASNP